MDKEKIEFDLKCLHNVMNNFEDDLCERMQIKVNDVKKYIEKQQKEIEYLKGIAKKFNEGTNLNDTEMDYVIKIYERKNND